MRPAAEEASSDTGEGHSEIRARVEEGDSVEEPIRPTISMFPRPNDEEESSVRPTVSMFPRLLASLPPLPFKPRWKPWSPQRVAVIAGAFGVAVAVMLFAAWPRIARYAHLPAFVVRDPDPPPFRTSEATVATAQVVAGKGRSPLAGGLLTVLPAFSSIDGAYDLVIHLHGNTDLVEQSFAATPLNAVLVVFNFGINSGVYEEKFVNPQFLPMVMGRANDVLAKRGLKKPHVRRLAITAWSAGYGGALSVLDNPELAKRVDAVLLLDGIHTNFVKNSTELEPLRIQPFTKFAERAAAKEKLFLITHSDILPVGYAGTRATTDALLKVIGIEREQGGPVPSLPNLPAIETAISKRQRKLLEPESHAERGNFIVKGYYGDQKEHHISHLLQMATAALPELVARWSSPPAVAPTSTAGDPPASELR